METFPITKIILPRKSAILEKFDQLKVGNYLVISNDHNPYILYYQLLNDRGESFSWEYLQKGPDKWRVRITKLPESS